MNEYMIDILNAIQVIEFGNRHRSPAFTSQVISKKINVYGMRADLSFFINSKSLSFVVRMTLLQYRVILIYFSVF